MEDQTRQDRVGMLGCDRDLFARVWARVEPEPGDSCPIEVLPPAPQPPALPPQPAPIQPVDPCDEDTPHPGDVPCLGRAGEDHGRFLQTSIRHELENWRAYQSLAARAPVTAGRVLAALAADERRHARRLSGAYFLIAGVRFTPAIPPASRTRGRFWGEIRQHFWAQQRAAALYAAAAEETADPCLAALYRQLSAEETTHADLLRELAERM